MAGLSFAVAILISLDRRVALALFVLLLASAAAPVVMGWLALLPAEREPFAIPGESRSVKARDPFAIFLLVNISTSLLLRIPGVDAVPLSSYIGRFFSAEGTDRALVIVFIWFAFIPGLAAAYSAVRANPIRWQLLAGGVLTLALWLTGPWLLAAIAGTN
jgi:hypothetical protein